MSDESNISYGVLNFKCKACAEFRSSKVADAVSKSLDPNGKFAEPKIHRCKTCCHYQVTPEHRDNQTGKHVCVVNEHSSVATCPTAHKKHAKISAKAAKEESRAHTTNQSFATSVSSIMLDAGIVVSGGFDWSASRSHCPYPYCSNACTSCKKNGGLSCRKSHR